MKTINTKYLRKNLKEVIDRVEDKGEEYTVMYRSKPVFEIKPVEEKSKDFDWESWFEEFGGMGVQSSKTPEDDKKILKKKLRKKYG